MRMLCGQSVLPRVFLVSNCIYSATAVQQMILGSQLLTLTEHLSMPNPNGKCSSLSELLLGIISVLGSIGCCWVKVRII